MEDLDNQIQLELVQGHRKGRGTYSLSPKESKSLDSVCPIFEEGIDKPGLFFFLITNNITLETLAVLEKDISEAWAIHYGCS